MTLRYVDNALVTGANNGSSWANAWRSLGAVVWGGAGVVAGDTLYISGGTTSKTYTGTGTTPLMTVGASGTAGNPITITKGVDAGHNGTVILDGQEANRSGVYIVSQSYVTLQQLTIQNPGGANQDDCIWCTTSSNIIIQDNICHLGGTNIGGAGSRCIDVRNSTGPISILRNYCDTAVNVTTQTDCIYCQNNADGLLIDGNNLYELNYNATGHNDAIQLVFSNNSTIRNNYIEMPIGGVNVHGMLLSDPNTTGSKTYTVYNNVINSPSGATSGLYLQNTTQTGKFLIYNNTIYVDGTVAWGISVSALNVLSEIKNNVIFVTGASGIGIRNNGWTPTATTQIAYNDIFVTGGAVGLVADPTSVTGWNATGGITSNPLFVLNDVDFHLQSASPCRNVGLTIGVVTADKDGNSRPQGAAYDIGAYEFVTSTIDLRLKSTADARGAALTDTTNLPLANDIFGTRRGTSGWDIGAHEFAAPAPDRARKLTNMLGMNIHISLGSALYTTTAYVADLTYMGVRVVRDHVTTPFNSKFLDVLAAGIKFDFAVLNTNPQVVATNVTAFKSAITNVGLSNIVAFEHQNEPNVSLPTYNGVTTTNTPSPGFLPVAQFSAALYTALKADAATLSLPVWHVTLPGAEPNNVGMQWLTIPSSYAAGLMSVGTVYGDALNIHSYPLGYGNGCFNDPTFSNAFDKEILDEFVTTWVGGFSGYADVPTAAALPKVITEGGFPTGTPSAFGGNVTTTIQARNILTGWLQAYRQSYQYYFIYEIYDDFGMLYGMFSAVGTPKASGTYLHNFSAIMADSGGTAETFTPIVFGVTVANLPTPGGQYAVFQKSDGSRWIVVWNEVKNWNFAAGSAITVGSTNVVITFDTPAIIRVFDPSIGTAAQATSSGTSVTVALTDFPKIISSDSTVVLSPIINVEIMRTVAASI